ncbi:Variant-specific surface protein [Giardia duodenalis]|uniref:Variant-specific surface protein n=1 Tax=Giardia intestinalis TaxID=5741 RepID=V6TP05_GIAIN|nr:Variant-specific surface protein [Giardia intestinalis]
MYKGGCYSKDAAPGSTMCTEAADGKCSAATTGYFVPPVADRDPTKQSVIPCGSEEEITAGNSHKYKGVANCKVCTAPENGDGADSVAKAATCTACVDGYYGSGNPLSCAACDSAANCATCSGAATACTSCKTSETANGKEYFRIKDNAAKTGECVTETDCKTASTHFPTTDKTSQKKVCTLCNDAANGGIADCQTCTPKAAAGLTEAPSVTCSVCTPNTKKPNKAGSKCFNCQLADCSHCSADGVCEECDGGKIVKTAAGVTSCVTDDECANAEGFFVKNGTPKTCEACGDENCATCAAEGTGKCSKCKTTGGKTYLKVESGSTGTCVEASQCGSGFFPKADDKAGNGCVPCREAGSGGIAGCAKCSLFPYKQNLSYSHHLLCAADWASIITQRAIRTISALLAIYLAVGALAADCNSGDASSNCGGANCEMVGTTQICTQCNTDYVPINGKCAEATSASNCKNVEGTSQGNQVCGKCEGATFMFKGGCYDKGGKTGNLICTDEALGGTDGVCEACNTDNGYFTNPEAANNADLCVSCGDATGVTVDTNKKYVGVANCAKCTKPDQLSEAGTKAAACTECAAGFLYIPTGSTSCVAECPKGYFGHTASNTQKKTCQSCATPASSLTPPVTGIPGCASCTYTEGDSGTLTCSECEQGKKPSLDGKSCNTCKDTNCAFCNSQQVCEGCSSGYILDGSSCVKSECTTSNCKTCTNPKTANEACTACVTGMFLTPTSQCIADCAALSGYYGDADKTCKECTVANCEACNDQGQCQTCINGFYKDSTGACQKCYESCRACSGEGATKCTECPAGKILKYSGAEGQCIEQCVVNAAVESGNCKVCGLTVEGTAYCSECSKSDEYPQNGVCAPKTTRAATCNDGTISGGVCNTCSNGFFLVEGGCYETTRYPGKSVCTEVATNGNTCQTAADGHYLNGGTLVTCPEGCSACTTSTTCTTCADGYVLVGNACTTCHTSCLTCETEATKCTECASGCYKTTSGSGACTSCEANNGSITGVKGCASCAAPTGSTGPVLCYLVGMALLASFLHVPVGMSVVTARVTGIVSPLLGASHGGRAPPRQ